MKRRRVSGGGRVDVLAPQREVYDDHGRRLRLRLIAQAERLRRGRVERRGRAEEGEAERQDEVLAGENLGALVFNAIAGGDGKSVRLVVDGLQEGHVHELHADGVRSAAGIPLLHSEAYYTLNYLPED